MRSFDQSETAAVQRQHAPIGPGQSVALLDLHVAKSAFAGDLRRDLCKLATLQGLQQIARVDDASILLTREPLIE